MNGRQTALLRMMTVLICLLLLPALAGADDAGVLSETELNTWVSHMLLESLAETPINAPVGEEALTEDGYAFLYSFATLYYNKPTLDEASVLRAVAMAEGAVASPRGIRLGDDASVLIGSYGWQNPMLLGDGSLAAFYQLDDLPRAAYWSWARQEGGKLLSVQCAVHVQVAEDRYTDAGILYEVEENKITGIRIYGLDQTTSGEAVRSNLRAVTGVEAAISGDEHPQAAPAAQGYTVRSDKKPFGLNDLLFGGVNYLNFTENDAVRLFGAAQSENRVQDGTGAWLLTTEREGLSLSYTLTGAGQESARLDSFAVSGALEGPRGIHTGMTAAQVLALFQSDGSGAVLGNASLLYGDGAAPPMGALEEDGSGGKTIRYALAAQTAEGSQTVTLRMTFMDDVMSEWMLYSW